MEKLNIRKKRVMNYFIEATEEIIRSEGVEGVSINKVAKLAGYNSATIYNYFDSIDHLILYASMNYLKDYINDLNKEIDEKFDNALIIYKKIYKVFNKHSFKSPEIFYNMFFSKYSKYLDVIIQNYLQIFPDYLDGSCTLVKEMLSKGSMTNRDEGLVKNLAKEGYIEEENINTVIQIITRTQQSYLYQALMEKDDFDYVKNNEEFFKCFDYVIEKS